VRRFALALLVTILGFSASGVTSLVTREACAFAESRGSDQDCPPTCVTCGCCAQAAEPGVLIALTVVELKTSTTVPPTYRLLTAAPGDVLHVPKGRVL
jgi:hypothetical protein